MRNHFQSALDHIRAEDELVQKTARFLQAYANTSPDTKGETVKGKQRSVYPMKKLAIAAGFVIVLLGLSLGGYAYYKHPVAYLSVDINPSVELGINAFDQVVSATAYNQDGQALLEGQRLLNNPVDQAVSALIMSAAQKGYMEQDGSTIVSVTSETDNPEKGERLETAAEQGVNRAMERTGTPAVVYRDNVALARRAQARELGITPGKLNLIQKLQALNPTVTVEQCKDAKVKDIMKRIIEIRQTLREEHRADADNKDRQPADQRTEEALKRVEQAVARAEEQRAKREAPTRPTTADATTVTGRGMSTVVEKNRTSAATTVSDTTLRDKNDNRTSVSKTVKRNTEATATKPNTTKKTNAETTRITKPTVVSPTNAVPKDKNDNPSSASNSAKRNTEDTVTKPSATKKTNAEMTNAAKSTVVSSANAVSKNKDTLTSAGNAAKHNPDTATKPQQNLPQNVSANTGR